MRCKNQKHESVLVVDDNPLILRATIAMFSQLGYEAFGASNSKEAMKVIREVVLTHKLLLMVLTDIQMPGENGDKLAKNIHKVCPTLSVFGFTSMSLNEIENVDQSHLAGLDKKPLSIDQCQNLLDRARRIC